MKLYSIDTELFKLDGGAMYGVVPKSIWNKLSPSDENNLTTWAMRCLLIEDGDRRILIDNGIGDKQSEKFFGYYYLHGDATLEKSLAKHGFSKDDITDVILTHLHFDHCGGSIVKENGEFKTAFKNATFWSNEEHWKWATENPNAREKASFFKENILPIKESGQLKFVPPVEGYQLFENVKIRFVNGHTRAMMIPQINYNGKTVVYTADLLPSVMHIPMAYVMAYDMFPMVTLEEKKAFLNEALENNYILFFEHDVNSECCTLQMTERGIREKEIFKVSEI